MANKSHTTAFHIMTNDVYHENNTSLRLPAAFVWCTNINFSINCANWNLSWSLPIGGRQFMRVILVSEQSAPSNDDQSALVLLDYLIESSQYTGDCMCAIPFYVIARNKISTTYVNAIHTLLVWVSITPNVAEIAFCLMQQVRTLVRCLKVGRRWPHARSHNQNRKSNNTV